MGETLKEVKEIRVTELKEKLDKKEEILLVDCREQYEWDEGHIEGAILLPMSTFAQDYTKILDWKDKEVIIQCRSGARSRKMSEFLLDNGFTDVTNLEGGILDWKKSNFPIKVD